MFCTNEKLSRDLRENTKSKSARFEGMTKAMACLPELDNKSQDMPLPSQNRSQIKYFSFG